MHKKALVVPVGTTNAGVLGLLRPAATSSMNRGGLKSFDSTILVLLYSLNLSYRPYGRYLVMVLRDPLTMLVSRIPRGANDVCTTRD